MSEDINNKNARLKEMEEATSLIAHLKDQHGFNDAEDEEEAQEKITKVFKYKGKW